MGEKKYQIKIEKLFENSPIVYFSSIERIIKDKRHIKQYSKQLVRNLILKGKIRRLAKGCYTKYEDPSLSVFYFNGYLGLQDSLSFHNLWEQETIPIIVTTKKVRQGRRKIFGTNVLIRRIDKKYFFGFDYLKYGNFYLPISDIEKTFIDLIYYKENLNSEILRSIKKSINKKRLSLYLKKYPKKFNKEVLKILKNY